MSCYITAEIQINDRIQYAQYESGFMAVLAAHQGQLIAVDESRRILEGQSFGQRSVILKFTDEAAAMRWYESDDYQTLMIHRHAASQANISIIHGLD